jgi:hypothetical protein
MNKQVRFVSDFGTHKLVRDGTNMIRCKDACPTIRVIREDLKDGHLGRYEQPGPAIVACVNERNESPRLGTSQG